MVRRFPLSFTPTKKSGILIGGSTLLIGATVVAFYAYSKPHTNTVAPSYDIVLPQKTAIESLGGWQRVSPAGSPDPVFSYNDTINDVGISVSQQPLPASFVGNVAAQVKQLAESYSASTVIEAGGTLAYIGRSARGPQSVILAKNNVLILIKSQKTISQSDWIAYINNLVDPKTEQIPSF